MDAELEALSRALGEALQAQGAMIAVAESCTGGWLAQTITDTAGSSGWFDRGFVTYANQAKTDLLGVTPQTLERFGAVSAETARAMAAGAVANSGAEWGIAVTGIAGPGGGSLDKPVGTVCFAWCRRGAEPQDQTCHFSGDRRAIRRQAVVQALQGVLQRLGV